MPARFGFYRAENIGRTAPFVLVVSPRFPPRFAGSYGFSYVSSTSSILAMYSSSSSATHHIFFPPRFEVVVEEQNPDSFPSHARNQFALDRFLGHQSHGPTGPAFGRVAAYHCDNALLLAVLEHRRASGALLFIERGFQPTFQIPMADLANGLRSERDHAGNPWGAGTLGQLQQRQSTQDTS